jgi:hypothetical protein
MITALRDIMDIWYHRQYHMRNHKWHHVWYHDFRKRKKMKLPVAAESCALRPPGSTMIEIIKWSFPAQIRYCLSYNRIISNENSLLSHSRIYLNWHQPQTMRTQLAMSYILGEFNLQTMKYIIMQQPARNETILCWMRQPWEFNSSATVVAAAVALPLTQVATLCVNVFGRVLISHPGRLHSHNLNWIYFIFWQWRRMV